MTSRPRKKLPSKPASTPATPSRRSNLHRRAKIIPSIEREDRQGAAGESSSSSNNDKNADTRERGTQKAGGSPVKEETTADVERNSRGYSGETSLSDDDSEYAPSEEVEDPIREESQAEESDGVTHSHKRRRAANNNASRSEGETSLSLPTVVVTPAAALTVRNQTFQHSSDQAAVLKMNNKGAPRAGPANPVGGQWTETRPQPNSARTSLSSPRREWQASIDERGLEDELNRTQEARRLWEQPARKAAGKEPISFSLDDRGEIRIEPLSQAQKRTRTEAFPYPPSRPIRPVHDRQNPPRYDPGEGSSRNGTRHIDSNIQYPNTLTRTTLQAGPPPGLQISPATQVNIATRSNGGNANLNIGFQEMIVAGWPEAAIRGLQYNNSRLFYAAIVPSPPGGVLPDGPDTTKLVECRNERNGLDCGSSNGKGKEIQNSHRCHACFKFRRICDGKKPNCIGCTKTMTDCTWPISPTPQPRELSTEAFTEASGEAPDEAPTAPQFTGSQLWERCQNSAALNKDCTFEEAQDDCKACKTRGWQCLPLAAPTPKKKYQYRGRNQDPKTKCLKYAKHRSHCDGKMTKCGHCEKWGYKCIPPGQKAPKKTPLDKKCKRCRQLKLACSEKLPCKRCFDKGEPCGPTAIEERMQSKFFGD